MAVEVPCPNCRATLRAPDNAAGKRVRCKKCDHRFHIPGAVPIAESVGDSQMLSVVDGPASVPAPPPPAANAFEFDTGPSIDDEDDRPRRSSRHTAKSGGNLVLILVAVGLIGLLGMGGIAVGAYVLFVQEAKSIASIATPPLTTETKPPTSPKPAPEPKETPKATDPGKTIATPKAARPVTREKSAQAPAPAAGPALALPSPPTGATTIVARSKAKITLESPANAVRGVRFAEGAAPTAAILWKSFPGFQGSGAKDTLDLYSTSTSRRYERIEFPADGFSESRLFDVSKDGQRVAIEQPPGKLTIYDTESKEKVIDGVNLFDAGMAGPVTAMRFLTTDKLLVFDRAGAMSLWDVPQKKAIVTGSQFGPNGAKDPLAAVSEVCGDRVFVGTQGGVIAVGVGNGQKIGAPMTLPNPLWVPLAIAADPNAKQVAVVFRSPNSTPAHGLYLFPPGGGKGVTLQLPLADAAGVPVGVSFPTDQIVSIHTDNHAGGFLYDLENRVLTAYIRGQGDVVTQFADPNSGRYWLLTADPKDDKKSSFTSVELPFDKYFDLVNAAKGDRKPVYLLPRADGLAKGE